MPAFSGAYNTYPSFEVECLRRDKEGDIVIRDLVLKYRSEVYILRALVTILKPFNT